MSTPNAILPIAVRMRSVAASLTGEADPALVLELRAIADAAEQLDPQAIIDAELQQRSVTEDDYRRAADLLEQANRELVQLAKLAADEPQFDNPLRVYQAKAVRDRVLAEHRAAQRQETR